MHNSPLTLIHASAEEGEIVRLNLKSGEETVISKFSVFEGSTASSGDQVVDVIVPGLTPTMTMACTGDRVFWGMNDSYRINITGLEGKKLGAFKVRRKKDKVSDSFKKQYFDDDNIPPDMLKQLVDSLPNEIACFHRIDIQNELVYVYVPELGLGHKWPKIKQIDIFSPEGTYLYEAHLEFGEDLKPLFSPMHNHAMIGKYLYVVLADKEDNVVVSKYRMYPPLLNGER